MLERLRGTANGQLSEAVRVLAQRQAPSRLEEMIVGAINNWAAEKFHAFAQDEHSFNVRICDHMQRIKRAGGFTWALVSVTMETGYPTAEQLAGNADPRKLKRPDIVARFGGSHEMHIEADGRYAHDPFGTMIAYVISPDPDAVLAEINARVVEEADLSTSDQLVHQGSVSSCLSQHRSEHKAGACTVRHHHVHLQF